MELITGSITAPKGFKAAATAAQIKYQGRDDMAMIYSEVPCVSAGCYTKNVVKAAPVIWDKNITKEDLPVHAVVVNSGIANACTGQEGLDICKKTAEVVSGELKIPADSVLLGSTGVIGMQLPMDRVLAGVKTLTGQLSEDEDSGHRAEKAIMTTDTVPKEIVFKTVIGGSEVTMAGMAKGSGMIHPNMCTMLAYITTDAAIDKAIMQEALSATVVDSFNMISVDGDTSTNDSLILLANGEAKNPRITSKNEDYEKFCAMLDEVCLYLAKAMAADGEGATKLVEAKVVNADTKDNARTLAKSVVTSSLTKAAMYGCDANWGRILCALGYSGVNFDPEKVTLTFWDDDKKEEMLIYDSGKGQDYSEKEATRILSAKHVLLKADMHMGSEEATAYGCDLTHEYVNINADYRS
ncbi:MAG: bifunctional glutamate N-acetyltransferase/amino-acid acetyltransferase ArgJ [Lachnospiraceae bacterium]|nr:bifunctional glutamate N-acetyltransferase/amino-acid acetyltransferase ArgJ [Lachnospiraceae bacterium]